MFKRALSFFVPILLLIASPTLGGNSSKFGNFVLKPNKTYYIDRYYNLGGGVVTMPDNCTLIFSNKGKIYNGEIKGCRTSVTCVKKCIGTKLSGTWSTNIIKDEWFDTQYLRDDIIINNINILQSDKLSQKIILNKEKYNCSIKHPGGTVLCLSSNTELTLNSRIVLKPNPYKNYSIISIAAKSHVSVNGGSLIGDVDYHLTPKDGDLGEWGMGVLINNSKDILIENIKIKKCWGDGVYIGGGKEKMIGEYMNASRDIRLINVTCDNNRRQGMSVTHVDGLIVENCSFVNTGLTKKAVTGYGVDIEPNLKGGKNQSCRNIKFANCKFLNNAGYSFGTYNSKQDGNKNSIEGILFENCVLKGHSGICATGISFKSCVIYNLELFVNSSSVDITIDNSHIISERTLVRARAPKRGFKGQIKVKLNKCKIDMYDAEEWIKSSRWDKINGLILEDCCISLKKGFHAPNNSKVIKRILRNSKVSYSL